MTDADPGLKPAPPTAPRPGTRRWIVWLALAAVVLVGWRLLTGGATAPTGDRAGRYALPVDDLAALGGSGARWQVIPPRISLDMAERAAAGLVPLPDDRHATAWRDAGSGAEVTQVTLLYAAPEQAAALLDGVAVTLLANHFGLSAEAAEVAGADEARRWRGPEWTAVSVRRGGVIAFVAAQGDGAPDPLALAGAVVARVAADPSATAAP